MSSKQRNLILAVHIDSSELHLVAGFVENNKVNVLATKSTEIRGITKGSYQNKYAFESSFITAIKDFLNTDLNNYNYHAVKRHKLQTHEPSEGKRRLVVGRIAFNILVNEKMGAGILQSNEVFKILKQHFFNENTNFAYGENCFKYTVDVAATNLFLHSQKDELYKDKSISEEKENYEYLININLGRNSTAINFVTTPFNGNINSKAIEFGYQYIVDQYNSLLQYKAHELGENPRTAITTLDNLYPHLRKFEFVPRRLSKVKVKFQKRVFTTDQLIDVFVQKLQ